MMLRADHYVPVLKVKRGETRALQCIALALRPHIFPLLEIVEWRRDSKPTLAAHLDTSFDELSSSLQKYQGCLLDARELAGAGDTAAAQVFERARAAGLRFVPVTGVSRTADVSAALDNRRHGLALRVTRDEFEAGALAARIRDFMRDHKLSHGGRTSLWTWATSPR